MAWRGAHAPTIGEDGTGVGMGMGMGGGSSRQLQATAIFMIPGRRWIIFILN